MVNGFIACGLVTFCLMSHVFIVAFFSCCMNHVCMIAVHVFVSVIHHVVTRVCNHVWMIFSTHVLCITHVCIMTHDVVVMCMTFHDVSILVHVIHVCVLHHVLILYWFVAIQDDFVFWILEIVFCKRCGSLDVY